MLYLTRAIIKTVNPSNWLLCAIALVFYINSLFYVDHYSYGLVVWAALGYPVVVNRDYNKFPLLVEKLSDFDTIYWRVFSWIFENHGQFVHDNSVHKRAFIEICKEYYDSNFTSSMMSSEYAFKMQYYHDHLNLLYGDKVPSEYYVLDRNSSGVSLLGRLYNEMLGHSYNTVHPTVSDHVLHMATGMSRMRERLMLGYDNTLVCVNAFFGCIQSVVNYLDKYLKFSHIERRIVFFIMIPFLRNDKIFFGYFNSMRTPIDSKPSQLRHLFNQLNYSAFYSGLGDSVFSGSRNLMPNDSIVSLCNLQTMYHAVYKYVYGKVHFRSDLTLLDKYNNMFEPLRTSAPKANLIEQERR